MKTLTDYAHDVVARAAHGQDRDAMVHRCAIFDTRGVLEAYLSNPGASGALLERLVDMTRADSFDDVCFATKRLRDTRLHGKGRPALCRRSSAHAQV